MKNKKGQALVEFVIILPIFIFMLLAVIDLGKMIYFKNELESELSDVVSFYRNGKTFYEIESRVQLNDKDTILEIKNEENQYITFYLKKDMAIVTPGLGFLFDNPFSIEVKRVIPYE